MNVISIKWIYEFFYKRRPIPHWPGLSCHSLMINSTSDYIAAEGIEKTQSCRDWLNSVWWFNGIWLRFKSLQLFSFTLSVSLSLSLSLSLWALKIKSHSLPRLGVKNQLFLSLSLSLSLSLVTTEGFMSEVRRLVFPREVWVLWVSDE